MHPGQLLPFAAPVAGIPVGIAVGASPFTYTATKAGAVIVNGGTLSLIQFGRGGALYTLGVLAGVAPVWAGDTVVVTYVVAPTMTFMPSP